LRAFLTFISTSRKRVELEEDERNALSEVELYKKSRTMEISSTDVNTPLDGSGLTPLMSACQQSTELDEALERVDVLLAAGANPNLQRDDGNTCLHLAAKFSSAAVVQRLVDQGARFNVKNDVGMTPLAGACRRLDSGAHLIVRILVAAANRMKDYSGVSIAIVVACWYSTYDVLMELRRLSVFNNVVIKFKSNCCVFGRSTCLMAASCNRLAGPG
jgi:hypothetical protein